MEYSQFYEEYGQPFSGRKLKRLQAFWSRCSFRTTRGWNILSIWSMHRERLQRPVPYSRTSSNGVAVDDRPSGRRTFLAGGHPADEPRHRTGNSHLFVFTKPKNIAMFSDLGFFPIIQTEDVLFMENVRDGIGRYVRSLQHPKDNGGVIGAAVMNCNPFTNGHRYLVETAASQCELLHLFVLSEDRSAFPAQVRYELVKQGVSDIGNVVLHHTSDYLISSAVFPTYFIKEKTRAEQANCELDLRIFCEYFAKELGITRRFVGTEPFCPVTGAYNRAMKQVLGEYGIEVVEIPRRQLDGVEISASSVRERMKARDL